MNIENSFHIDAAPALVFSVLIDIESVAPCFPGAKLTETREHNSYSGEVRVKLGPVAVTFVGEMVIVAQDSDALTCTLQARASDRKQRGTVESVIVFSVTDAQNGTLVHAATDLQLSGPIAQYGRAAGMIEKLAAKNIDQFAAALAAKIAATTTA
jgi:uncharacterized protein